MPTNDPQLHKDLVEAAKTPETHKDVPVLGEYFTGLSARILHLSPEELDYLANAFNKNSEGKMQLKMHNPFVEAAIYEMIEPTLRRLIKDHTAQKRKETEEETNKE